ncbi:hypothetical protein TREMEDRAFT_62583 [Tremella mesenterica DSM 1558]|uniref:uncharacterized protein n=1 Tax=Tremella mesenterica (strain ATCC 24925 / CBS 8224 / DSM 1558 / NBRC 9311 / NRRL Y-6157 / RJB 2259-6 / UBC 559-6) TaxID=578456 RepID=UPI0003F4A0B6|nr:uncharacterized protein TREMEDRAFT_62583 [Tremella mesenterica DSM 1558]EIW68856.1 hypothetical protein TREMEDRAFT_62583 [Tremella mesenterica DSM 1558]
MGAEVRRGWAELVEGQGKTAGTQGSWTNSSAILDCSLAGPAPVGSAAPVECMSKVIGGVIDGVIDVSSTISLPIPKLQSSMTLRDTLANDQLEEVEVVRNKDGTTPGGFTYGLHPAISRWLGLVVGGNSALTTRIPHLPALWHQPMTTLPTPTTEEVMLVHVYKSTPGIISGASQSYLSVTLASNELLSHVITTLCCCFNLCLVTGLKSVPCARTQRRKRACLTRDHHRTLDTNAHAANIIIPSLLDKLQHWPIKYNITLSQAAQILPLKDKLSFLTHSLGICHTNFHGISVNHCPEQYTCLSATEEARQTRETGYLNFLEAVGLDVILLTSGFNVLKDSVLGEYVGIINFRDLRCLSVKDRDEVLECMKTLNLVTHTTHILINLNGAAKSGGGHGRMHAFGWKGSFAGGVTRFDQYTPKAGKQDKWKALSDGKMTQVARHLEVEGHAAKEGIPWFDAAHVDVDIGDPDNLPLGANSLTVTCNGFSNIHHRDQQKSLWAFGLFWSGKSKGGRFTGEVREVCTAISGGEFWWAEDGVAVGAAPDDVYAEVAWRVSQRSS